MKRTFDFGKIDLNRTGRRINRVTIDVRLEDNSHGKEVFAASASIWNSRETDIICGGQCLDELVPFLKRNRKFMEIHRLWKKHHLNDAHAGTETQELVLRVAHDLTGTRFAYETDCAILEKYGLLEDNGYKYGSGWLYREIPEADRESIIRLIEEG
jgi:hypothetical protein